MIRPSETLVGTNLNSVWVEGFLVADPEAGERAGEYRFEIQDSRSQDPEPPSIFVVEATTFALEGCRSRLGRGHRVRIIGRLKQDRREVRIIGELVEAIGPLSLQRD